jgi:signal transduction histidine kinase
LYESLGDLKQSLVYYKRYDQMKDSIYSKSLTNRIASLQNEFMLVQKNQEIELLNKDKALRDQQLAVEQSKVQQQRIVIVLGSLFLVILGVGVYLTYKNYKKVTALNRTIQENNEEIQSQSEELQLSNQMIIQINDGLEEMVETRTNELKQAYKELDTFFYRASHDFRRPLTTFMGLAEVAKITVTDSQALGLFEKVNETARGLDKMLFKLQSISDVGSTHLIYKEIYFDEVLNSVSDIYRDELKEKDIRIAVTVDAKTAFTSYPGLIKVIIENLIENSIAFSYQHKTIQVRVGSVEDGVRIEIEDAGYGIEQEYHGRVFDMYFRGHERSKGNGLGLYIVKRVVEKLKGTITLTSAVGVGTTIKLFLPIHSQQMVIP